MKCILKRIVAASAAVGMAVSLAACGTTAADLQNQVSTIEAQVQSDANLLCGFIPTVATIAAFIPGAGSIVADAATIAGGICEAVSKAPVVGPASARVKSIQLGVDVKVGSVQTPTGTVDVVGKFTR